MNCLGETVHNPCKRRLEAANRGGDAKGDMQPNSRSENILGDETKDGDMVSELIEEVI